VLIYHLISNKGEIWSRKDTSFSITIAYYNWRWNYYKTNRRDRYSRVLRLSRYPLLS